MKKLILISSCLLLLFSSCKKEKTAEPASSTNSTNTTNNATSWYGILTLRASQNISSGILNPATYSYSAFFANSPVPAISPSYSVTVDSVKANTKLLSLSSYDYITSGSGTVTPVVWNVYGNNGIPSFNFTNNNALPTYTGYGTLPDSISISQSLTVTVINIAGYDKVTVMIFDGSHDVAQQLATGATSVTFSASALSALTPTTPNYGTIWVILTKNNVNSISSKDFNFVNEFQFSKYIKIY